MGFGCIEETFVRGGSFCSWNRLHLEVMRFLSPEMFKKEVMNLDKRESDSPLEDNYPVVQPSASTAVSDLGFLDASSRVEADVFNKCL